MANNKQTFFQSLFDISVREQVALTLCNSASDNFFLLSGPPDFLSLAGSRTGADGLYQTDGKSDIAKAVCPLLFTQSFNDIERKMPDPQIGSFGTANVITAPSAQTTTQKMISIGAAAYVTTNPWAMAKYADNSYIIDTVFQDTRQRWNLLKRIYFWLLNHKDETIRKAFKDDGEYIGDEADNPRAVAPDQYAPWGNFGKSDIYKVPFGLMVLVAAKDKSPIAIRYYEGCILQDVDGGLNLRAGLGTPTAFGGTSSLNMTYTRVRTFTERECKNIAGEGNGAAGGSILTKLLEEYGSSTATQA